MKTIVLVGSSRKKGNSDLLADAFISGVKGNVEKIYVSDLKINSCIGCNACKKGSCIFKDEMPYEKLKEADNIVIVTPIYFYNVSSQLKKLIDRLHNPIRNSFKVKKLGLLMVCADTISEVFDSVIVMYKSTLKYFNLEDGGILGVRGVNNIGDIKGNILLEKAKEMGETFGNGKINN